MLLELDLETNQTVGSCSNQYHFYSRRVNQCYMKDFEWKDMVVKDDILGNIDMSNIHIKVFVPFMNNTIIQ